MMNSLINALPLLLKGLSVTIQIACASLIIGLVGGIVVGVLNSRNMPFPFLKRVISFGIWIIRGTPSFLQVLIVYYALPEILGFSLSAFAAGVIALGINSIAYVSEIVRGSVNAIADGQWEGAYVLGFNRWKTIKGIILPQMFQISSPALINEMTALIKETSILMMIGVAELTKVSKDIVVRELDPMTIYLATAALYLLLTSTVTLLTHKLQKRCHA